MAPNGTRPGSPISPFVEVGTKKCHNSPALPRATSTTAVVANPNTFNDEANENSAPQKQVNVYQVPRRFLSNSKLHALLSRRVPEMVPQDQFRYTLYEVIVALKKIITDDSLFDPRNPTVVICDQALEEALGMKALHVTELKDQIGTQLVLCTEDTKAETVEVARARGGGGICEVSTTTRNGSNSDVTLSTGSSSDLGCQSSSCTPEDAAENLACKKQGSANASVINNITANGVARVKQSSHDTFDIEGNYLVHPKFLRVIRQINGVDPRREVFNYKEVTGLLSRYILERKDKFFDDRNIKIALVEGDSLGEAFGVRAFHRTQVTGLVRGQLAPYKGPMPVLPPLRDLNFESSDRNEERLNVTQTESRKRNSHSVSECEASPFPDSSTKVPQEANGRSECSTSAGSAAKRQRRRSDRISVTVEFDYSSSGEETIYSAQGYETVPVGDESSLDTNDVSSSDERKDISSLSTDENASDDESDVYQIEYEIDTGSDSDSDHSKDSNGKKWKDVEDSEADSDIDDVTIIINADADETDDAAEMADSSDTEEADSGGDEFALDAYDPELHNGNDNWHCLKCDQPNMPFIRYCHRCWQERKGWVPERPKPHRKRDQSSKNKRTFGITIKSSFQSDKVSDEKSKVLQGKDRPDFRRSVSESSGASTSSGSHSEDKTDVEEGKAKYGSSDSGISSHELGAEVDPEVKKNEEEFYNKFERATTLATSNPSMLCSLCCVRTKDACFVHGKISHQVCCYQCAKKLYKKKKSCPVCRRKIEKITKNILA